MKPFTPGPLLPESGALDLLGLIAASVRALLLSRRRLGARFTDLDDDSGVAGAVGPFSSMQGIRAVLGACTALAGEPGGGLWAAVEPDLPSLFNEWREVLSELDREGYTARPYDRCNQLAEILNEGRPRSGEGTPSGYVDSLSWVVSTAVLFAESARQLAAEQRRSPSAALLTRNRQRLGRAVALLLDAQRPDGGWGWARGAEAGHLYFTWTAVEGLADLDDFPLVLAGSEPAQRGVLARIAEARERACTFLVRHYLEPALARGLTLEDFTLEGRLEPLDRRHEHVLLYYELYLLESLILLRYPGGGLDALHRLLLDRLDGVRALPAADPFWSDPKAATLRFRLRSRKPYRDQHHSFVVQDPGLWPQCLRTLILYRLHREPGESFDPEIESALRALLDDRREARGEEGEGLWDRTAFNLTITTRSIEALLDAHRYRRRFACPAPSRQLVAREVAREKAERVPIRTSRR